MSNPTSKSLSDALYLFFIMLAVYCIDIFFWKSDLTVLGDSFYARFISFVILFMLVIFKREHLKTYGISTKKEKLRNGLLLGTILSVVPVAIVSIGEYALIRAFAPSHIKPDFVSPNLSFVGEDSILTPLSCIIIYFLLSLFGSCFKEMFFRGFLLHKFKKITTFHSANLFQALLYMTFILPMLIRNFGIDYYDNSVVEYAVYVVAFYIAHELITGLKWGLLTDAGGSTYISIIDSTLYTFLVGSIKIASPDLIWLRLIFALCVQIISFALTLLYCKQQKLTQKEKRTAEIEEKIQKARKPEKSPVYSADLIPKDEAISPSSFKQIIRDSKQPESQMSEEEIDSFLKSYGKTKHQGKNKLPKRETTVDPESFDVDSFLKGYKKKQ